MGGLIVGLPYTITNGLATFWNTAVTVNVRFWRETFGQAWNSLPLDQKLAWIILVSYTTAVITLLELLLLK